MGLTHPFFEGHQGHQPWPIRPALASVRMYLSLAVPLHIKHTALAHHTCRVEMCPWRMGLLPAGLGRQLLDGQEALDEVSSRRHLVA